MGGAFLRKKSLLDQFKDDYRVSNPIKARRTERQWADPIVRRKREKGVQDWAKSFAGKRHYRKLARFNAMRNEGMKELPTEVAKTVWGADFATRPRDFMIDVDDKGYAVDVWPTRGDQYLNPSWRILAAPRVIVTYETSLQGNARVVAEQPYKDVEDIKLFFLKAFEEGVDAKSEAFNAKEFYKFFDKLLDKLLDIYDESTVSVIVDSYPVTDMWDKGMTVDEIVDDIKDCHKAQMGEAHTEKTAWTYLEELERLEGEESRMEATEKILKALGCKPGTEGRWYDKDGDEVDIIDVLDSTEWALAQKACGQLQEAIQQEPDPEADKFEKDVMASLRKRYIKNVGKWLAKRGKVVTDKDGNYFVDMLATYYDEERSVGKAAVLLYDWIMANDSASFADGPSDAGFYLDHKVFVDSKLSEAKKSEKSTTQIETYDGFEELIGYADAEYVLEDVVDVLSKYYTYEGEGDDIVFDEDQAKDDPEFTIKIEGGDERADFYSEDIFYVHLPNKEAAEELAKVLGGELNESGSRLNESGGADLASAYGSGDIVTHESSADGFYVDDHDPMGWAILNNDVDTMKELFAGTALAPDKPWLYAGWDEYTDAPADKDGSYPYRYSWDSERDLNFVEDWKRVVGETNNEEALNLLLEHDPDFIPTAIDFYNAFLAGYDKKLLRKLLDNIRAVWDEADINDSYLDYEDFGETPYENLIEFLGE